jgi:D-hydroxyproline dehydrogenase subunit gamma
MPETIPISVNGVRVRVPADSTLAAALLGLGFSAIRRSVTGIPRGPLCGMGICFECRVTVDGVPQVKSCQTACLPDMQIELDVD